MEMLPRRTLGTSGLEVSVMSLGSWRTFERIPRDQALEVMFAARESGINFLDDARYDDETGSAPLSTGYSEVVFGDLFRVAGWIRDEVVVTNKLWWEHWPDEDAITELDGSLSRMGLAHVDLIYAIRPPDDLPIPVVVEQIGALLASGRARAWGTGMWSAGQHHEALAACRDQGVAPPSAAQMATSLVDHAGPDDPEMRRAFDEGTIGLVASYVLAGGTLTGKYLRGETGRATGTNLQGPIAAGVRLAPKVGELADELGITAAHLAFAFALDHPHLASIVFGATTAEQVRENVAAVETHARLDADARAAIAALAA